MVCIQSSLFHPCSKGERIGLKLTLLILLNSVSGITTRRHVRSEWVVYITASYTERGLVRHTTTAALERLAFL